MQNYIHKSIFNREYVFVKPGQTYTSKPTQSINTVQREQSSPLSKEYISNTCVEHMLTKGVNNSKMQGTARDGAIGR